MWLIRRNTTSIKLATSLANAIAGSPTTIAITAGTAKLRLHSYYIVHTSGTPKIENDSGSIKVTITGHGLSTGDVIKYKNYEYKPVDEALEPHKILTFVKFVSDENYKQLQAKNGSFWCLNASDIQIINRELDGIDFESI